MIPKYLLLTSAVRCPLHVNISLLFPLQYAIFCSLLMLVFRRGLKKTPTNYKKLLLLFCTLNCSENSSKQVAFDLIGTDQYFWSQWDQIIHSSFSKHSNHHKYLRASLELAVEFTVRAKKRLLTSAVGVYMLLLNYEKYLVTAEVFTGFIKIFKNP